MKLGLFARAACGVSLLAVSAAADVSLEDIWRWGLTRKPAGAVQYPVFNIPLNGWSEVELKASTNNYRTGVATNDLLYWFESLGKPLSGWTNFPNADVGARLYYCNPDGADPRAWVRWTNGASLTQQIGTNSNYQSTVIVIPSPSVLCGRTNFWMTPENDALVWSFRRRSAAYGETNRLGKTVWHTIVPSAWRERPFNP